MTLAALVTRRAQALKAQRSAEEGRWAPGSLRGKLGRAGTDPSVSGLEPAAAGAPSSAASRSATGSQASSLDAEAGGLRPYTLNPVGSGAALARSAWGSGAYAGTPSAGGRIATPFSAGVGVSAAHATTLSPLHACGPDAALRPADAMSCSPSSSGRSGGGGDADDRAPGGWAGEPWRFGGAGGGELISFADLQFSRCIGQVCAPRQYI